MTLLNGSLNDSATLPPADVSKRVLGKWQGGLRSKGRFHHEAD